MWKSWEMTSICNILDERTIFRKIQRIQRGKIMGHHLPIIDDLLEDSVDHAKERYVIVQLGARYGTCLSLSARFLATKRPNLSSMFIGVEASRPGYSNLMESMKWHGLNSPPNVFRQVAVSDSISSQAFLDDISDDTDESVELVETTTIEEIIKNVGHVDFLEMDIQGAEYKAIPCSMSSIAKKVKMICVRTHWSLSGEKELEDIFHKHRWQKVLSLYNGTRMVIEGREQALIDGVLCWVNTNLREPCGIKV
jgi:FkbM family methyltransferase